MGQPSVGKLDKYSEFHRKVMQAKMNFCRSHINEPTKLLIHPTLYKEVIVAYVQYISGGTDIENVVEFSGMKIIKSYDVEIDSIEVF